MSLSVGQHSLCPLHVSLQQLGASHLTGLLGRRHCGDFGLGTGGGAAGYTGEILSRLRRTRAKSRSSGWTINHQAPLEFPSQGSHRRNSEAWQGQQPSPGSTGTHSADSPAKAPPLPALPLSPRERQAAWQLVTQVDCPAPRPRRPGLCGPRLGASSSSQRPDPEAQSPCAPRYE